MHIHTPVLTASNCECGGDVFSVVPHDSNKTSTTRVEEEHFFGTPAFTTVSGQLHLEACAMGVGDVYTLNPAFRSEKSHTRKHLNEFRMLEIELAYSKVIKNCGTLLLWCQQLNRHQTKVCKMYINVNVLPLC